MKGSLKEGKGDEAIDADGDGDGDGESKQSRPVRTPWQRLLNKIAATSSPQDEEHRPSNDARISIAVGAEDGRQSGIDEQVDEHVAGNIGTQEAIGGDARARSPRSEDAAVGVAAPSIPPSPPLHGAFPVPGIHAA